MQIFGQDRFFLCFSLFFVFYVFLYFFILSYLLFYMPNIFIQLDIRLSDEKHIKSGLKTTFLKITL